MITFLERVWVNFINSGQSGDIVFLRKFRFINVFSFLGIISLLIVRLINSLPEGYNGPPADLLSIGALILNLLFLRWTKMANVSARLILAFTFLVFIYLLVSGGDAKTGIYWLFSFPILALFVEGKLRGLLWVLAFFLAAVGAEVASSVGWLEPVYPPEIFIQFLSALILVTLLAYAYESVNEQATKLLNEHNTKIEISNQRLSTESNSRQKAEKEREEGFRRVTENNQELERVKSAMLNVLEDTQVVEEKLKGQTEELRKFQLAAENAYEHIIITDSKGVIIYANKGAERNTGYSKGEMFGKTTSLWGGQMSKDYYQKMWKLLVVEKKPFVGEIVNKRKSGEQYTAQINIAPVLDEKGEIKYFVSLESDITKERILEEKLREEKKGVELKVEERTKQLREEQARLEASINSLNVGFLMTDMSNNLVAINPVAKRLLCFSSPGSTRSLDPLYLKLECKIEDVHNQLKENFDFKGSLKKSLTEKRFVEVKDLPLNDNHLHLFMGPIVIHRNNNLEVIGAVILIEDITEEKRLDRSKDEFFSIASHELRTPLTSIRGNSALIQQFYADKLPDKEIREMIDDIHTSSERLIEIVNDFLDVSRLEQGRLQYKKIEFDLKKLIKEAVFDLKTLARDKGITLKFTSPLKMPLILADPDKVKQVMTNLVGNAIKFTEVGGVEIKIEVAEREAKIAVADTGRGIAPKNQNLLFKKFQQAGESLFTRDTTKGTGLGLYISKLMLEGMGGKIRLEKSVVGKGSVFVFTLPLVKK